MRSVASTARAVGQSLAQVTRWVLAAIGLVTAVVAVVAWWRFGWAWAIVALLAAVVVALVWSLHNAQVELDTLAAGVSSADEKKALEALAHQVRPNGQVRVRTNPSVSIAVANKLANLFTRAGWTVNPTPQEQKWGPTPGHAGILVGGFDAHLISEAVRALTLAGFAGVHAEPELRPPPGAPAKRDQAMGTLYITVGHVSHLQPDR